MKPKIKIDKRLINQSELARRLGVSQTYINMILSGERTGYSLIPKIKKILDKAFTVE